ncbi:WYL domain-containing protein [Nocardioides perillae]|uniref:Proteasome accessory factor B n=1 Tax=Nocardioides perillae TaxID=1119534 RepID=A0A7Y9RSN5_9ACTN|nr:proteasome accessory factor B [Nocardioides perillae]
MSKSERLLNLLIMLLVQRRYLTKSRIRAILYPEASEVAFERMFDRDKEELRSLGVPIEVGQLDPLFDDEPGYRIRADELGLPPVELEPDEAAVVGVATKVWEHARMARATSDAVAKLRAAGVPVDTGALDLVEPRLSADEPAFDVFWEAAQERREVVFDYARPGHPPSTRHLQPWGVARFSGRWYAVGLDTDRGEERVFRLSRVVGEARAVGDPAAYDVPPGTDVAAIARRLGAPSGSGEAVLLVRAGAGHALRRTATVVEAGVTGPDGSAGWDRLRLPRTDVADEVLAHGPDVVVEEPATLRDDVVARLRALLGEPGGHDRQGTTA